MKYFMIRYRFTTGTKEAWHQEIARFIAAVDEVPALKGKLSYRCMKNAKSDDYYHIAWAADDEAIRTLQQQDFFKHYSEAMKLAGGGEVEVLPLEIIAETACRA